MKNPITPPKSAISNYLFLRVQHDILKFFIQILGLIYYCECEQKVNYVK